MRNMGRKEMTDTIEKLLAYNQWRRGDEELPQPDPAEIGRLIDFACDELRRLECERDEARKALAAAKHYPEHPEDVA
jgi:hypothetical protein